MTAFEGWPAVLGVLTAGGDLSSDQARTAMSEILDGAASPAQIAGFIVALRMKGETVAELDGMLQAMFDAADRVELPRGAPVVDVVGTGGDRAHTINVSTLAALVVAGAGGRVCKHGNRAASSSAGTADVLEALGVRIDCGPAEVARCVADAGIGFCFAPRYHPAMRHAGPTRRELGIPTAFNMLGPLANPAGARRLMIGVADPAMAERMAGVLAARGAERAMIVHGHDGLDELTIAATSRVVELRDGDKSRWGGKGVMNAVRAVNGEIADTIVGYDAEEQSEIDATLIAESIAEQISRRVAYRRAMKHAVIAGREAYLAGRMGKKRYADPSSPLAGPFCRWTRQSRRPGWRRSCPAPDRRSRLDAVIASVSPRLRVVRPGYREGAALRALYAEATALVFPSLCESFGIPVVEAMAQGCPVAIADSTASSGVARAVSAFRRRGTRS